MAMLQLNLKIVTPEKEILSESVDQVNVSTTQGILGILPNHSSLMAKIVPGHLQIKKGSKLTDMAIGDGFMQIQNGTLTIMTDLALDSGDINEKAVEEAKKRAEMALAQTQSDEEYAETLAMIEKLTSQLRVKRRHRNI